MSKKEVCHYLFETDLDSLKKKILNLELFPKYKQIVLNYLKKVGATFRLSHPGKWGIQYPYTSAKQVIFASASIVFHCLLYGENYCSMTGMHRNPFERDSGVTTIAMFGKDIVLPYVLGTTLYSMALDNFKGFDFFNINEFFYLENKKFSTSRKHAIWVQEIIQKTPVNSDMIRYYVSHADLTTKIENFSVSEFLGSLNKDYLNFMCLITHSFAKINGKTPPEKSSKLIQLALTFFQNQNDFFSLSRVVLDQAIEIIKKWSMLHALLIKETDHYWWLKGFSLLAYPFIPELAEKIWQCLGHEHYPTVKEFSVVNKLSLKKTDFSFVPLSLKDIEACLPVHE